jgi:hypothetical protein
LIWVVLMHEDRMRLVTWHRQVKKSGASNRAHDPSNGFAFGAGSRVAGSPAWSALTLANSVAAKIWDRNFIN